METLSLQMAQVRNLQFSMKKGNHIKDIPVPYTQSDRTEISRGQIDVTYGLGEKYEIAEIKNYNYKTIKSVRTTSTSWENGQLVVKLTFEGINLYDGLKIRQIKDEESFSNRIYNIVISHRHIYYSSSYQNIVSCLGLDGTLIWKYESDSLQHPTGVTTDGYGNVYVVGRDSKNLIVISKDGQNGRKFIQVQSYTLVGTF
ncbi:unnamed protein product [Mytilus coruscus]|uniref:Uncharacterized protein n=1 Tax=Mytilus coruscus TaxID=42192 RepID=A0A6J8BTF8_MYTCO|nr:unnamed protein product [Mytilus coruscus]